MNFLSNKSGRAHTICRCVRSGSVRDHNDFPLYGILFGEFRWFYSNGLTDARTHPLIEMRDRIIKSR